MKLHNHFRNLLTQTVNINSDRLRQLADHEAALIRYLSEDPVFSRLLRRVMRQGSWAHGTIIKPHPGQEFDADLVLQMNRQRSWKKDPQQYLLALHEALDRSGRYQGKIQLKSRCVRVSYAGDCHVDLVPYIHEGMYEYFDYHYIVNRTENCFEEANPAGFACWVAARDKASRGHLRHALRFLKYMRDQHGTFDAPSVILTVLIGERVTQYLDFFDGRYRDLPSSFKSLLNSTSSWLQDHCSLPPIYDPVCRGTRLDHRLTESSYAQLRGSLHSIDKVVAEAYASRDSSESMRLWQTVFGPSFGSPVA